MTVVYGINPRKKRVQAVYVGRDRILSGDTDDGTPIRHLIKPGWTAEREAGLIFGLREVFGVPIAISDSDSTKRKIEELRVLAADWNDKV